MVVAEEYNIVLTGPEALFSEQVGQIMAIPELHYFRTLAAAAARLAGLPGQEELEQLLAAEAAAQ